MSTARSGNIYLVGFMGAGKSSLGRALAARLGMPFVDTDQLIEQLTGRTIADLFAREGEGHFRQIERQVIETVSSQAGQVVAVGGGAVMDNESWRRLQESGTTVYIKCAPSLLTQRLAGDRARPLLQGREGEERSLAIAGLLAEREPRYCQAKVVLSVDETATLEGMVSQLLAVLGKGMETIDVKVASCTYPVHVAAGLLARVGELLAPYLAGRRVALVTDSNVAPLYAATVSQSLRAAGAEVTQYILPAGEASKSLRCCQWLWGKLLEDRLDRSATVVALGGGVVGDLAGFVASTYLRGVDLVHIPTTLIAQVDSALGGKTGVNHPAAKNIVGTFYHPRCVLIDPAALATLKSRDLRAGFAEVLKYAIVAHPALFRVVREKLDSLLGLQDEKTLAWVISECCQVKARIVGRDEREQGMRRVLNFGHTIGHALEAATKFRTLRHGEAVLVGMRGAAYLSAQRGLLPGEQFREVRKLLDRLPCPVDLSRIAPSAVIEFVAADKKHFARTLHFVGLRGIGWPQVITDVTEQELMAAIEYALGRR